MSTDEQRSRWRDWLFGEPDEPLPPPGAIGCWTTAQLQAAVSTGNVAPLRRTEHHFAAMVTTSPATSMHYGTCGPAASGIVGIIGTLLLLHGASYDVVAFSGRVLALLCEHVPPMQYAAVARPLCSAVTFAARHLETKATRITAGTSRVVALQDLVPFVAVMLHAANGLIATADGFATTTLFADAVDVLEDVSLGADAQLMASCVATAVDTVQRVTATSPAPLGHALTTRWCLAVVRRAGTAVYPADITAVGAVLCVACAWRPVVVSRDGGETEHSAVAVGAACTAARTLGEAWRRQWLHSTAVQVHAMAAALASAHRQPFQAPVVREIVAAFGGVFAALSFPPIDDLVEPGSMFASVDAVVGACPTEALSACAATMTEWWTAADATKLRQLPDFGGAVRGYAGRGAVQLLSCVVATAPLTDTVDVPLLTGVEAACAALQRIMAAAYDDAGVAVNVAGAWDEVAPAVLRYAAQTAVFALPAVAAVVCCPFARAAEPPGPSSRGVAQCLRRTTVIARTASTAEAIASVAAAVSTVASLSLASKFPAEKAALVDAATAVMASSSDAAWRTVDEACVDALVIADSPVDGIVAGLELWQLRLLARVHRRHTGWFRNGPAVALLDGIVGGGATVLVQRFDVAMAMRTASERRCAMETLLALRGAWPAMSRSSSRLVLEFCWWHAMADADALQPAAFYATLL
jgi:hypothetical protein